MAIYFRILWFPRGIFPHGQTLVHTKEHWFNGVSMEEVSCGLLIKMAAEILAILMQKILAQESKSKSHKKKVQDMQMLTTLPLNRNQS